MKEGTLIQSGENRTMAKQIKIRHWLGENGKDVCLSVEPYIAYLDHEKGESAEWAFDSPHTKSFSIEFVDSSPFDDDKMKFDQGSAKSSKVKFKGDKNNRHKYNIVVDGVTIDPIIVVRPPD